MTIARDNVVTEPGFALIRGAIVDQHFIRRRRNNRLFSLILEHPDLVGVGIDESTAVEVDPAGGWRVLGRSVAVIYDARRAAVTPAGGAVLGAAEIRMSVLPAGSRYDLRTGRGRPAGAPVNFVPAGGRGSLPRGTRVLLDLADQLAQREGLAHQSLNPERHPEQVRLDVSADDDHRYVGDLRILHLLLAKLRAAHDGHHPVEEDQGGFGFAALEILEGLTAVPASDRAETRIPRARRRGRPEDRGRRPRRERCSCRSC